MTITKEGALASFYTVNKAPIKHLKVYFSPKQAGSGDASPENVREISGWNSVQIHTAGRNLIRFPIMTRTYRGTTWTTHADGTIDIDGTVDSPADYNFMSNWNNANEHLDFYLKAGTYVFSGNNPKIASMYLVARDGSTNKDIGVVGSNATSRTFTLTQDTLVGMQVAVARSIGELHITFKPQLELIEVTKYEKPTYNTYNITFPSTIYGGYIDLITGELVQEQIGQTFKGSDADQTTELTNTKELRFRFYTALKGGGTTKCGLTLSDKLMYQYHNDDKLHYYATDNNSNGNVYAFLPKDFGDNDTITLIMSLYTPVTYQLTPQEINTFIGQNNIWSNADRIEVEYDLAESNDELYRRRNIILQSAPHLETATGDIANFNTDLIAPIKDTKIYFNPVQEGEDDPSLENIRPINGWTGLDINQTGKNLIDKTQLTTGRVWWNGSFSIGWPNNCTTPLIAVQPGATYYLYRISNRQNYVNFFDKDKKYIKQETWSDDGAVKQMGNNVYYIGITLDPTEVDSALLQIDSSNREYEAYINNIISIEFPSIGKNLLNITKTEKINPGASTSNITISNGVISIDAVASSARSYVLFSQKFPAGTYTIQVKKSGAVGNPRLLTTSEISNSSYNTYYTLYSRQMASDSLTFTLTQTSKIGLVLSNLTNESGNPGTIYDIQLENGSTATSYEPYTNTIYGGYVDLVNGEIVADKILIEKNSSTMNNSINYPGWKNSGISNYFGTGVDSTYTQQIMNCGTSFSINTKYEDILYLNKSIYNNLTQDDWIALAINIQILLSLTNPIHYPLTPQTLKTLKGANNIWSNANGPVSITYWTH